MAECLETPEALSSEKSLDLNTLKMMLIQRYPNQIAKDYPVKDNDDKQAE